MVLLHRYAGKGDGCCPPSPPLCYAVGLFIGWFCFFSFCYTVGLSVIGNALTETNFADGEFGTIYRSLGFADDGNDLVKTTDARGNTTEYTVDNETSGNEEIIDRLGNIIAKYKYSYDGSGNIVRILDMLSEIEYTYTYEQGRIIRATEARVSLNDNASATKKTIVPANGIRTSKTVGSIISIVDKDAFVVARYSYDAWGKVLSITDKDNNLITDATHIAYINPFRYRGYFFDNEIGCYYLQSRYYNPSIGRFVNSDEVQMLSLFKTLFTVNLFVYCRSNPSVYEDNFGCFGISDLWSAIKDSFNLIKSIADQAYKYTGNGFTSKEINQMCKYHNKSRNKVIKELKAMAKRVKKQTNILEESANWFPLAL